jgi:hypothetical protein
MKIILTQHIKDRIKKRKITENEVTQTIISPEKLTKKEGKYYAQKNIGRGNIEVVYEKETYINVITVYWIY